MPKLLLFLAISFLWQCRGESSRIKLPQTEDFSKYWYDYGAEITRYALKQNRYGQRHSGEAVLIFVTEPFLENKQVKADNPRSKRAVPVLKLNLMKKFSTGIYPYSIMSSVFTPIEINAPRSKEALKVSTSIQEWCGHVFLQLNNTKTNYHLSLKSYFESQGDIEKNLEKSELEDAIWNQIRIDPQALPLGDLKMIPSIHFLQLKHVEIRAYQAVGSLKSQGERMVYSLRYPKLKRTLSIVFEKKFPYAVLEWEESHPSGWTPDARVLTTQAKRTHAITLDYWNKNRLRDKSLRKRLGLMD